jgi:hypothetical protein
MWVFVGNLAVKPFTTPLLHRFRIVPIIVVATVALAATFVAAALVGPDTSPVVVAGVLLLSGVFRSVGFTAYHTLQFADVPAPMIGPANAIASITSQLAVGLGVAATALAVRVADVVASADGQAPAATGYQAALIVLAVLALLSVVEGLRLPRGTGDALRTRAS